MAQNSATTWIIVIIIIIVVILLGWWYFSTQSSSTTTTSTTQSSEKSITAFSFDGLTPVVQATIDDVNHTIMLTVPKGTNVTKLTPTITVSNNATVSPASGAQQDFTNPVTYTVTAQDSSTQAYTVTVTVSTTAADSVSISSKTGIGQFLTDTKGMTLYYFLTDKKGSGKSACTGSCATLWPPFSTANIMVSTPLKTSDFSMVTRTDNQQQLAYKGWPLYYYANDTTAGDVKGEGIGKVWYAIKP